MHGQPIHKTNLPLGTVNPMPATAALADASAGMCGGVKNECALAGPRVRTRRSVYPHLLRTMLREVLRRCDAEYVHLISGQDYPMKPLGEFLLFFEQHRNKDCMQYF